MTLNEAFVWLDDKELIQRKSRPETGAYSISWLKSLMDWETRENIRLRRKTYLLPLGPFIIQFLIDDALADDWEETMEYHALMPDYSKVEEQVCN